MTLRKTEGTGKWKHDHQFTFSEENVLDETTDLSQDRTRGGGGGGDHDDDDDDEEEDDIISNISRLAQTHIYSE